jgi:RimJ/RimL family protein N-acetyltransferase
VAAQPVGRASVALRDVVESDLQVFFEQQLEPEATRMAAFPARDHDAFFAHWHRILGEGTGTVKTIVVDGDVGGNVVSWVHDGVTEVGYWLGREYWGRGIATQALAAFVAAVGERPLTAAVAEHNVASMRVLEKCGFVRSGKEDEMVVYRLSAD